MPPATASPPAILFATICLPSAAHRWSPFSSHHHAVRYFSAYQSHHPSWPSFLLLLFIISIAILPGLRHLLLLAATCRCSPAFFPSPSSPLIVLSIHHTSIIFVLRQPSATSILHYRPPSFSSLFQEPPPSPSPPSSPPFPSPPSRLPSTNHRSSVTFPSCYYHDPAPSSCHLPSSALPVWPLSAPHDPPFSPSSATMPTTLPHYRSSPPSMPATTFIPKLPITTTLPSSS